MALRLATALIVAAVACGSIGASPRPAAGPAVAHEIEARNCEVEGRPVIEGYSNTLTLVAALPTTASAAAHWEMTRFGPNGPRPVVSRWSGLPADHRVLFCYFDGDFANYAPPGPRPLVHERALVFVTDGQGPWLDHIGSKANTPLTAP